MFEGWNNRSPWAVIILIIRDGWVVHEYQRIVDHRAVGDNARMRPSTSLKLLCGPAEGVSARNGCAVCETLTQLRQFWLGAFWCGISENHFQL